VSGVRETGGFATTIHKLRISGRSLKGLPRIPVITEALKIAGVELVDSFGEGGRVDGRGDFAAGIGGTSELFANPRGRESGEGERCGHAGDEVGLHWINVPVGDVVREQNRLLCIPVLVTLALGLRFDEGDEGVEGERRVIGRSGNSPAGGEATELRDELDHAAGILRRMKAFDELVVPS